MYCNDATIGNKRCEGVLCDDHPDCLLNYCDAISSDVKKCSAKERKTQVQGYIELYQIIALVFILSFSGWIALQCFLNKLRLKRMALAEENQAINEGLKDD